MTAIAGGLIGVTSGDKNPIGSYVADTISPAANTGFIGVNTRTKYDRDVLGDGETNELTCTIAYDTTESDAQWVKAGDTIAADGLCTITDGIAEADVAGLHTCLVTGGVVAGDYFWAVLVP